MTPTHPARDVRHLGDFTATPRMLLIAALAVPIGGVAAGVSWALLRLIGLTTNAVFYQRTVLRAQAAGPDGIDGGTPMAELMRPPAAVTHGDQPLRHVAELMARHEVSRIPVVDRGDDGAVIGIVGLSQLLAGRRRDQQEARERERVLRVRLIAPIWARR